MAEPFDSFADRIVRNGEYQTLVDAIRRAGGEGAVIRLRVAAAGPQGFKPDRYIPMEPPSGPCVRDF